MTAVEEGSLPNLLRATASLIRMQHTLDCPDLAVRRREAALLDRVASAEESGAALLAGERDLAIQAAKRFLAAREPAGVSA